MISVTEEIALAAWPGFFLNGRNLARDLFRCLGCLVRQFLDLGCNDRKALAGLARTGCLDRRVQRQKVGLLGNCLNERDHFADPAGRFRQAVHALVGGFSFASSARCYLAGRLHLTSDFVD